MELRLFLNVEEDVKLFLALYSLQHTSNQPRVPDEGHDVDRGVEYKTYLGIRLSLCGYQKHYFRYIMLFTKTSIKNHINLP